MLFSIATNNEFSKDGSCTVLENAKVHPIKAAILDIELDFHKESHSPPTTCPRPLP